MGKECTHGSRRRSLSPADAKRCWKERAWWKSTIEPSWPTKAKVPNLSNPVPRLQSSYLCRCRGSSRPSALKSSATSFAAFAFVAASRRYCLTDKGSVDLVPTDVQHGDQVCIFLATGAPFVIRCVPGPGGLVITWLESECYIDGLMKEHVQLRNSRDLRDISLV